MFVPENEVYGAVIPYKLSRSTLADSMAPTICPNACFCYNPNPCASCNACNCPYPCPCRGTELASEGAGPVGPGDPLYNAWRGGLRSA